MTLTNNITSLEFDIFTLNVDQKLNGTNQMLSETNQKLNETNEKLNTRKFRTTDDVHKELSHILFLSVSNDLIMLYKLVQPLIVRAIDPWDITARQGTSVSSLPKQIIINYYGIHEI